MKKDIIFPQVVGVQVALALTENNLKQPQWASFLINENTFCLHNILITSKGYGTNHEGVAQKTSILRHFFQTLAPKSWLMIEPVDYSVLHLCNEYWVSYTVGKDLYDKRYIFMPDSILETNIIHIQMLGLRGVLHC